MALIRLWKVVARDVNGELLDTLLVTAFKSRAEAYATRWRMRIDEPLAGKPLHNVFVERYK